MKKVITNGTVYTGKEIFTGISILIDEGRILGFVYNEDIPDDYEVHDIKGNNISHAFIDLQIYGGNSYLYSADPTPEAIEATYQYCLKGGATKFLLTIATNAAEVMSKGIAVAKQYKKENGKGLLGLHLEGPWINREKRGAHLVEFIHKPVLDEVKKLIDEADGIVKMITLAPEVVDEEIIDFLQDNKIIVSAGHSNARYKEAIKGFEKIKAATHLFNAMSQFQGREPGMVGAIYNSSDVNSSIVVDGIHVDFSSVQLSKKILGEKLFLITDAVAATTTGAYQHILKENQYVLPDGTLSGSALTMMLAVKNCVHYCGIDLEEALRMAALYPAKILGLENEFGIIERNRKASFTVFDNELNLVETIDLS